MIAKSSTIVICAVVLGALMIIGARADTNSKCARLNAIDRHYLRDLRDCREHETDVLPVTKYIGGIMDIIDSGYMYVRDAQDITLGELGLDDKSVLEAMFWERNLVVPNFPYDKYPWARYIDTRTPIYAVDYKDQLIYIIARDATSIVLGHDRARE